MSKWDDFVASAKPREGVERREWFNMTCGTDYDPWKKLDFHQGCEVGDWQAAIEDRPGGYAYTCATAAELIWCINFDRWINPDYWEGGNEKTLQEVLDFLTAPPGEVPDRMFGCGERFDPRLGWVSQWA